MGREDTLQRWVDRRNIKKKKKNATQKATDGVVPTPGESGARTSLISSDCGNVI